jgi:hypothetical protein
MSDCAALVRPTVPCRAQMSDCAALVRPTRPAGAGQELWVGSARRAQPDVSLQSCASARSANYARISWRAIAWRTNGAHVGLRCACPTYGATSGADVGLRCACPTYATCRCGAGTVGRVSPQGAARHQPAILRIGPVGQLSAHIVARDSVAHERRTCRTALRLSDLRCHVGRTCRTALRLSDLRCHVGRRCRTALRLSDLRDLRDLPVRGRNCGPGQPAGRSPTSACNPAHRPGRPITRAYRGAR